MVSLVPLQKIELLTIWFCQRRLNSGKKTLFALHGVQANAYFIGSCYITGMRERCHQLILLVKLVVKHSVVKKIFNESLMF
jgi:hypothetical protein